MPSAVLQAMSEKLSAMPVPVRALRWMTNSASRGAVVGAGAGALHGAATASPEDGKLRGAVRGAIGGGVLGAGLAHAGRSVRDVKLLNPSMSHGQAAGQTLRNAGTQIKNFGKRQVHGVTGAYDPANIGMNSSIANAREMKLMPLRRADQLAHGEKAPSSKNLRQGLHDLREQSARGDANIGAGITSIPGIAKGLVEHPGKTLGAMKNEALSGGAMGKALAAVPLAQGAYELSHGDESASGGRSIKQKLVSTATNTLGGAAMVGMPMIPQLLGAAALESGARRLTSGRKNISSHPG